MAETEYVNTSMSLSEASFDGCPAFEEFGDMSGADASIVQDATDGAAGDAEGTMGDFVVYGEDYDDPGSFGNEDLQSVGPVPRLAAGVVANDFEGQPPLEDQRRACRSRGRDRDRRFGMFGKDNGDPGDLGGIAEELAAGKKPVVWKPATKADPRLRNVASSVPTGRRSYDNDPDQAERLRQEKREEDRLRAEREERESGRRMQLFSDIFGGVAQAGAQIGGGILQQKADARAARRDRQAMSQSGPVSYGGGGGGGGGNSNLPWIVGGVAVLGLGAWLVLGGKKK